MDVINFGVADHTRGRQRETAREQSQKRLDDTLNHFVSHYEDVQAIWDREMADVKIPIRFDIRPVVATLNQELTFLQQISRNEDEDGLLHEPQIITVIKVIAAFLKHDPDPGRCGLLLGALQGGKTTVAVALQFLGPIYYLLTGKKIWPIYLIPPQRNHEDQVKRDLIRFSKLYGNAVLRYDDAGRQISIREYQTLVNYHDHPMFEEYDVFSNHPTLNNYRSEIIGVSSDYDYDVQIVDPDQFVQRRVPGSQIGKISRMAADAVKRNIEIVPIIDEAQFGASDRVLSDGSVAKCVMRQIRDGIKAATGRDDLRQIVISATPFPHYDISALTDPQGRNLWRTHLMLSASYVGYNFFGGSVICDGMDGKIRAPRTVSFSDIGEEAGVDLFANGQFSMRQWIADPRRASDSDHKRFTKFQELTGYGGSLKQYHEDLPRAMRDLIMHFVEQEKGSDRPVGICVRLCNNNSRTQDFIAKMQFDDERIHVLEFFNHWQGSKQISMGSVKRFIHETHEVQKPGLPFVMFVTNKARMGDAFPRHVKYFVECPERATTLESLLQGLLGRACGYHKDPTVILSDFNLSVVLDWIAEKGGHVYRGSIHATPINYRRGRPSNMFRVERWMADADPVIRRWWNRVEKEALTHITPDSSLGMHLKTFSSKIKRRAMPADLLINERFLVHLESSTINPKLRPGSFHVTRLGENAGIVRSDRFGVEKFRTYTTYSELPGYIQFSARWPQAGSADFLSRRSTRGIDERDTKTDLARREGHLEPQINMETYDPDTRETVDERHLPRDKRRIYPYRVSMITLPLIEPVQEIEVGTAQLPKLDCVYAEHMTEEQLDAVFSAIREAKGRQDRKESLRK